MAVYEIAGLRVKMDLTGRTLQQAEAYRIEDTAPAEIVVQCDPQDILNKNPILETLDNALYMGTGEVFAVHLLRYGGFQLHSSAVMLNEKAYLFSAPSGTGKSTHTEKWCRLFGAQMLNDDKPVLRRQQEGWIAYGTPWSGKYDLSQPTGVPLGGIAFLSRGQENTIRRMEPGEAVPELLRESPRGLSMAQMERKLALLDQLLLEIPVWKLYCRNEDAAAQVSYRAMTQGAV